ncbi:hypothetical protein GCM10010452_64300 [Crossiella cryophila]
MGDYQQGLELLRRLGGTDNPAVLDLFAAVRATDFGADAVAYVYGGLYQRPGLTLPQRQLITVSALAALGYATAQLRFHLTAALNLGCPASHLRDSLDLVTGTFGTPPVTADLTPAPDEPPLDHQTRLLTLLAAYTATGGIAPQVDEQLRELCGIGAERAALETILHISVYAGFPAALNALTRYQEIAATNRSRAGR